MTRAGLPTVTRAAPWSWPQRAALTGLGVLALLAVTADLGAPGRMMFDEVYYVADARELLADGEIERLVHPPLAVQLIAASIALLGDHPAAWRLPSAMAGAVTVVVTALIARQLTARTWLATLAGGLVLVDGVFLVQARIAMLDAVVVALVVTAVWALLVDRYGRTPAGGGGSGLRGTVPWGLLGAGAALGLASAAKWSGLFALAGVATLAVACELGRRGRTEGRRAAWLVVAFVVLPAATYTAVWVPWMVAEQRSVAEQCPPDEACATGLVATVGALGDHHLELARFHDEIAGTHRSLAPPTTWLTQTRPVNFLWERCDADGRDRDEQPCAPHGRATQIVSLGNLAVWWTGLAAVPLLAAGLPRRDHRDALVLTLLAAQYLPWLLVSRPAFNFYAVTLVPFVALAIVVALDDLAKPRRWSWAAGSAGLAASVAAVSANLAGARVDLMVAWSLLAATVGAAVGAGRDRRGDATADTHPRIRAVAALAVAVAAVALFAWFAPVWFGIESDLDALRARWFSSWA